MRRTGQAVVASAAVLMAITACGTPPPVTPAAPNPLAATTPAPQPDPAEAARVAPEEHPAGAKPADTRCTAADLSGELKDADAGAGQRYATLVVTNKSGKSCTLFGYGGMELRRKDGERVPTKAERSADPGPKTVMLPPGQKAGKKLHWSPVPAGAEPVDGPCAPTADVLAVTPPDDTKQFTIPWTSGYVCNGGKIDGTAYFRM
ncbi:hypothetical protein GCM10022247_10180 [Allokutzneria multivorans]|uniref:DUF4232 domain-containing protein n=1 Tax=Allokutzneria multivorans TaxID=1142134 RepID=A0ABP7R5P8_9PSEU